MGSLKAIVALSLSAGIAFAGGPAHKTVRWHRGKTIVDMPDGGRVVVAADDDQVGIEQVATSPRGDAVGWVTTIRGCCTSYPIPSALKVYAAGQVHVLSRDMPVWYWEFQSDGELVAYMVNTTHGNEFGVYELREIAGGTLRARHIGGRGRAPGWVRRLEATRARKPG